MSSASTRKLRGGYYTPLDVTRPLARWAIRSSMDSVLEPSFGDGTFVQAVYERFVEHGRSNLCASMQIVGCEIDGDEVASARARLSSVGFPWPRRCINEDFFTRAKELLESGERVSCVLGNPPFIRYQDFPADQRAMAVDLLRQHGFTPNGLTNIWVPFLILSALLIDDRGRLAMVVPAELFQVNYAAETRRFLNDYFDRITIATVNRLLFSNAQQEVVLLLAERIPGVRSGIRTVEIESLGALQNLAPEDIERQELKPIDHAEEKWTKYFLDTKQILLLRQLRSIPTAPAIGELASVDVGVVTGRNDFFVLSLEAVKRWQLEKYVVPIVTRSPHLRGTLFDMTKQEANVAHGFRVYLLALAPGNLSSFSRPLQNYLRHGEELGVPTGYKCRIRRSWYSVPSTRAPDAFALRQISGYPKLVVNEVGATCTDTIHRVRFNAGVNGSQLVSNFLNSLTFAISEVTGRSYGGGVMTFEPTEIERLPVPAKGDKRIRHKWIDSKIAQGDIYSVLEYNDHRLLARSLGLAEHDIIQLRSAWERLRDRRLGRKV